MKIIVFVLAPLIAFIFGCNADKAKTPSSETSSPSATGRAETRGLEAAGIVGYDGAGMRRSLDNALDQNDARNAEMKKTMEQTGGK
ncbi:MAG TPA: hypothetical protein VK452_01110 [Dissulfurispiraceae bacterium]|nr:hypothetical protein [Dissulfurispiraceae bacterium]